MNHPHESQAAAMARAGELTDGEQLRDGDVNFKPLCKRCEDIGECTPRGLQSCQIPRDIAAELAAETPTQKGVRATLAVQGLMKAFDGLGAGRKDRKMKVTDEVVNRFLMWKLPADFSPDSGISFKRESDYDHPVFGRSKHEPMGTNLLNAEQARAMLEHVLADTQPTAVAHQEAGELPQPVAHRFDIMEGIECKVGSWLYSDGPPKESPFDSMQALFTEAQMRAALAAERAEVARLRGALKELRLVVPYFWNDDSSHIEELDAACEKADEVLK